MQSPKLLPVTVRSNAGDPEDREVRRVPVTVRGSSIEESFFGGGGGGGGGGGNFEESAK